MAKKKKKPAGRRMGASKGKKNDGIMTGIGVGLGVLGALLLDSKLLPNVDGKIKGGGEIVLGGFASTKAKMPVLKGLSYGVMGWGIARLVTSFTGMTVSGIGCTSMTGYSNVASIGNNGVKRFPQPAQVGANRRERISTLAAGGM